MVKTRLLPFLLAAISLTSASGAEAQTSEAAPMWGVRAALDLNMPGKWHAAGQATQMFRSGAGGSLGAVCNLWLGSNFSLEPGALLFYDTYAYKDLYISADSNKPADPPLCKFGVRIPVMVCYTLDITDSFAIVAQTGPEFSYAFAGKVRLKGTLLDDDKTLTDPFAKDGGQRRWDLAWKAGLAVPFESWQVGLEGAFGLTDLYPTPVRMHDRRLSLSLTRYF